VIPAPTTTTSADGSPESGAGEAIGVSTRSASHRDVIRCPYPGITLRNDCDIKIVARPPLYLKNGAIDSTGCRVDESIANGMLMAIHGIDADRAFDMLRKESQDKNVRLNVVATDFVQRLSQGAERPAV
jgi:hypothetical protein